MAIVERMLKNLMGKPQEALASMRSLVPEAEYRSTISLSEFKAVRLASMSSLVGSSGIHVGAMSFGKIEIVKRMLKNLMGKEWPWLLCVPWCLLSTGAPYTSQSSRL